VKQSPPGWSDVFACGINRNGTGSYAKNQRQDNDHCQVSNRFFHRLGAWGRVIEDSLLLPLGMWQSTSDLPKLRYSLSFSL